MERFKISLKDKDYDENENGKRMIYCTFSDTGTVSTYTNISCPHCEHKQIEIDMDCCGIVYEIKCNKCDKEYEMCFDA